MLTIKPTFVIRMIINGDGDMKLYEHKYMDFVLKDDRIDFIWKADTADMKKFL